jgi:S1-C subfamily serine protease
MHLYHKQIPAALGKFFKLVIWLFVISAIGFAGYIAYKGSVSYFSSKDRLSNKNFQELKLQVGDLSKQIESLAEGYKTLLEKPNEVVRREYIKEQSQEELLTASVAKVAPAVVSVIISKDVPQYEVVYVNPFGNDPDFKDVGIRVPRYRLKGTESQQIGAGTGFLISKDGHIVTNRHVVDEEGAYYTVLLSDGSKKDAQILYKDAEYDIALLKIVGTNYKYAELGNSDTLKLGQSVFSIGNMLGEYSNSVSVGIVSGLNRTVNATDGEIVEVLKGVIQTDAAINKGNSGGPLVDLAGKVIGVNVAMVESSENIGFSIPINVVRNIVQPILK